MKNRKQWPRTLNSSSVIHVSTSLTSPPSAAWARQARVLVLFYFKSITAEGASRASGQGWGMLNKSRGGGAGGILAALDKKSPALAPLLSHTSSPPVPAFLTQLPTVMDDDMCHIKSTCINRGSASSMLAWLNRRSELRGDMWHLRHSNPPRTPAEVMGGRIWSCQAGKEDTSSEGLGSRFNQAGSRKPDITFKITNGS